MADFKFDTQITLDTTVNDGTAVLRMLVTAENTSAETKAIDAAQFNGVVSGLDSITALPTAVRSVDATPFPQFVSVGSDLKLTWIPPAMMSIFGILIILRRAMRDDVNRASHSIAQEATQ